MSRLAELLARHAAEVGPVLPLPLAGAPVLDLSGGDAATPAALADLVERAVAESPGAIAVGRWGEDRVIYRTPLFAGGGEPRSVHLGLDLWAAAGTPVRAPLPGRVHSFADNAAAGDYGGTVILEHALEATVFYTLAGHLSRASLDGLAEGQTIARGQRIGWLGEPEENGGWPPHLHLQVIADLMGWHGDFPGVAAPSKAQRWLVLCPDPAILLTGTALASGVSTVPVSRTAGG